MSGDLTVTTAVFPVAGLGTRFLPATNAMPKELLPIIDRPFIQYAVEEAIAEHFDAAPELERALEEAEYLGRARGPETRQLIVA